MRCAQPAVRRGHCARRRVSERNRRTAAALGAEIDTRPTFLPVKGLFLQAGCARFRGHFFIVRGRGGASPARGFAVMTILRVLRRGGIHAARRSHSDNAT